MTTILQPTGHRWVAAALSCAFALQAASVLAADISATPPAGGGFVVKDSGGQARLQVMGTGEVYIPGLPQTGTSSNLTCHDSGTGELTRCAAGVGQGPAGPAGPTGPAGPAGTVGALTTDQSTTTNCNSGSGQVTLTAECSAGTHVISGGCYTASASNAISSSYRASATQWTCTFKCAAAATTNAQAYCQ